MEIAIIVAFVVVIHLQCLVSVYLSLVKIKYSVCVEKKKKRNLKSFNKNYHDRDFPGGAVVRNPPANAGDMGSSPGPGGSRMPRSS